MTLIHRRTLRAASCVAAVGLGALAGCARSDGAAATTVATTAAPSIAPPTTAPPATTAAPNTAPNTTSAPLAATSTGTTGGDGTDNGAEGSAGMSDEAIKAVIDPRGESTAMEVLARGDVDGDGDEDAVVLTSYCGASCGSELDLILNEPTGPIPYEYSGDGAFAPWFTSGGAAQSSVTAAAIDGSTITLTGTGLCGELPVVETDEPGACNYTTERTATYLFNNGALEPISIEPEPG